MTNPWIPATVALAATGATLGTLFDAMHAYSGTTEYRTPAMGRLAWWVPPLFAAGGVALGLARPLAERVAGRTSDAPSGTRVAGGIALFGLAYAASGAPRGERPQTRHAAAPHAAIAAARASDPPGTTALAA